MDGGGVTGFKKRNLIGRHEIQYRTQICLANEEKSELRDFNKIIENEKTMLKINKMLYTVT